MKIKVTAGVRDIYYYTRIINQANLNTENYLNFATGFYERCLNGNDEDGMISQTIEPNEDADNTTLAHMDIHSSGAHAAGIFKTDPEHQGIKRKHGNTGNELCDHSHR